MQVRRGVLLQMTTVSESERGQIVTEKLLPFSGYQLHGVRDQFSKLSRQKAHTSYQHQTPVDQVLVFISNVRNQKRILKAVTKNEKDFTFFR